MFFFLKKLVGSMLMPLSLALIALLVGMVLLKQRKFPCLGKKTGTFLLVFGFFWLAIFGNVGISCVLLQSLEDAYPPISEFSAGTTLPPELKQCKYVVVLGAGTDYKKDRGSIARLGQSQLSRLAEGIRILHVLPGAKLIVSGASRDESPTTAQESERAAVALKVIPEKILRFDSSLDTREEIELLKKQAGDAPVALVTSAFHLPRAMALCRELKVNAVACPSDYWARPLPLKFTDFLKWDAGALRQSQFCFHEWLGRLFA
jgi:uncharacterized SAM-binding protein YcdF (DUF218 family)